MRYLENTFFGRGSDENQGVEEIVVLCDFHSKDCSSKCGHRQDASAILVCLCHQTTLRHCVLSCFAKRKKQNDG